MATGRLSGAPPIHGNHFDHFQTCPAISYLKHRQICTDLQCSSGGQVCLACGWGPNKTNLAACCGKQDLPQPDERGRYPCIRHYVTDQSGTFCKFGCCATGSTVCGDGCCRPGDHGGPHKCGRTLRTPRHGKGGKPCCVAEGSSPSKQEESGCCIRGQGIDCRRNETACCLWVQGDEHKGFDPDPHSPCQMSNCSFYRPCPHGEGYDCTAHGQRICCLRPGGPEKVSQADPCQPGEFDCEGRWQKCAHGVGSDCSLGTRHGQACCLPFSNSASNSCQEDCSKYHPPPAWFECWWLWLSIVAVLLVLSLVAWWLRKRRQAREPVVNAEVINMVRPPAWVICNSKYNGDFKPLPWAMKDGEGVCRMLDKMGYHVIESYNASENDLHQGAQRLVKEMQEVDCKNPIIPIYYAGHGVEMAGVQFLVPITANSFGDPLIALDSLMECPAKAYLKESSDVKPMYFCILDACRLQPHREEDKMKLMQSAASIEKKAVRRKQTLKPDVVIFHACESGYAAQQCPWLRGHGFLTRSFLQHGWREMPIQLLVDTLKDDVQRESLQRATLQKPQLISAVNLQQRFLCPGVEAVVPDSRSTSASCIQVCSSRGDDGDGRMSSVSLMTSAMGMALLNAEHAESATV